jgi:hypothetical protein
MWSVSKNCSVCMPDCRSSPPPGAGLKFRHVHADVPQGDGDVVEKLALDDLDGGWSSLDLMPPGSNTKVTFGSMLMTRWGS